ncbi:MAG: glycine hydroxymethyltransferase [Verrucomicrobia bacterium]|nr:glycine hydroxymethyltransferase [Verrucomicrobiota bacterium]MBU6446137.1 glycine hydroxymethyltransferase [Verrucomicrobiota bacterium]MDE3047396.1 glycine hydroxymethyltransferase [Verrucomicrobiota bacterium]
MAFLKNYFAKVPEKSRTSSAIAYMASLDAIGAEAPEIARSIVQELKDQRSHLKLIASENFSSLPVQLAMGNLLTDKYSEGYTGHRFYAGCENVDAIEGEAVEWAKKIFGADHAYVQPHSGADANLVAFWAILVHRIQSKEVEALGKKTIDELSPDEYERVRKLLVNQKMMGMDLGSGGHLTHGYRHNVSAKMFHAVSYGVSEKTGLIDYKELADQVKREKPLVLIAGYSAYPRLLDFAKMREIADSVGAVLMVDMAHFAGLVAGKVMKGHYNPVPYAHIVTSTTHKTLRGPRGGLILCTEEYREVINKGCPIVLGGPLPHVMAAKTIAFKEASRPEFSRYAHQIVENAQSLAAALMQLGVEVVTQGTDNHLVIADVRTTFGLTGRQAESALREAKLTMNRNMIPKDVNGPWYTSGVRMGTPALTTLGMKPTQMKEVASIFTDLLRETKPMPDPKTGGPSRAKTHVPPQALSKAQARVADILREFPLYPELVID